MSKSETTDLPPELIRELSVNYGGEVGRPSQERNSVDLAIARLHASGVTLQVIADAFGISRQRVHQICRVMKQNTLSDEEIAKLRKQLKDHSDAAAEVVKRAGAKQHPRITDAIRRREHWRDIANGRD